MISRNIKIATALILAFLVFAGCAPQGDSGATADFAESGSVAVEESAWLESDFEESSGSESVSEEIEESFEESSQFITEPMINGTELKEFVIVYSDESDYNFRAAEYIQSRIESITGIKLTLNEDDEAKTQNEIVVGETNREISAKLNAETENLDFATLYHGGSVALEGEQFVIAAAAYYFVDTYVTDEIFQAQIPEKATINKPITKKAKSFILLIGDGMGIYQTKLFEQMEVPADNDYSDGEKKFYGYMLPYYGTSTTDSLSGLTDSAAAGTALSTGYKTINQAVGKDENGKDLKLITELALEKGMSAAVMSTEASTGATPSAFSAHVPNRYYTDELLSSQEASVLKGMEICADFNFYDIEGIETIENNITQTLEKISENKNGFFIMYEEAHIDKHCHNNHKENTFLAVLRFNQAVGRFMEFAFYNPDTAVIITADHETGALAPDENGIFVYNSTNHSQAEVPVFAYGEGMEVFHGKKIDNVQIPKTIAYFMGEEGFGDPKLGGYLK